MWGIQTEFKTIFGKYDLIFVWFCVELGVGFDDYYEFFPIWDIL